MSKAQKSKLSPIAENNETILNTNKTPTKTPTKTPNKTHKTPTKTPNRNKTKKSTTKTAPTITNSMLFKHVDLLMVKVYLEKLNYQTTNYDALKKFLNETKNYLGQYKTNFFIILSNIPFNNIKVDLKFSNNNNNKRKNREEIVEDTINQLITDENNKIKFNESLIQLYDDTFLIILNNKDDVNMLYNKLNGMTFHSDSLMNTTLEHIIKVITDESIKYYQSKIDKLLEFYNTLYEIIIKLEENTSTSIPYDLCIELLKQKKKVKNYTMVQQTIDEWVTTTLNTYYYYLFYIDPNDNIGKKLYDIILKKNINTITKNNNSTVINSNSICKLIKNYMSMIKK
jgi:hypothetical protein